MQHLESNADTQTNAGADGGRAWDANVTRSVDNE